jgi:hypothetical protein
LQVPIARQRLAISVERDDRRGRGHVRRRARELEHRGAFVDLVEHRTVQHRVAGAERLFDLAPEEPAAAAGNLVDRRIAVHVPPRKSGKHDRHVLDAGGACLGQVGNDLVAVETIDSPLVAKAADGPWADDVE